MFCLFFFITAGTLSAELIVTSHPTFGATAITLDTTTNLRWLDLTASTNMSFNAVSAQLGPGGLFSGFQFATLAQVDQLFLNASFSSTDGQFRTIDYTAAQNLIALLGSTISDVRSEGGQGLVNSFHQSNASPYVLSFLYEKPPFSHAFSGYAIGQQAINNGHSPTLGVNEAREFTGSFLIQVTAVPEPSSVTLILFVSLVWCSWRRRIAL